jgi:hypothetical protein
MNQENAFRIICLELSFPGLSTQSFDANPKDIALAFNRYNDLLAQSGPSLAGHIEITLQNEKTGERSVAIISATGNDLFFTVPTTPQEYPSCGIEN